MSFKPFTEKYLDERNWILMRIRIRYPGSDPDPHQNETDPKHCILALERILYIYIT